MLPGFIEKLDSPNPQMREQAVWGLANLALGGKGFRKAVLDHGALLKIVKLLDSECEISFYRRAVWALVRLCGGELELVCCVVFFFKISSYS